MNEEIKPSPDTAAEVDKLISEHFRRVGATVTKEQRVANGRRSWETRRANMAKKLEAERGRDEKSS